MRHRLLLIEDEDSSFAAVLSGCGVPADVVRCATGQWDSLRATLPDTKPDLLVPVASGEGPEWPRFFGALTESKAPPILAILREGASTQLIAAAARTADDFILWADHRGNELRERVARLLGHVDSVESVAERLTRNVALARLVGNAPSFAATIHKIPIIARTDGVVLIVGETGTGKELCARAIHHLSSRRRLPFIPVDCAALPDQLLENELFGHVRGAFTDAHREQGGLVAMAEGGTLFLDEIDSLALPLQAKLLRLIEDRTYKQLGADRFAHPDIRIIAAANRQLDDLVREKQFRSDLFFRLNVLQLRLPSLRERRCDIPLLAQHFVEQAVNIVRTSRKTLTRPALEKLMAGDWPGNVRELFNVIQQAVTFAEGPLILAHHIMPEDHHMPQDDREGFRDAKRRAMEAFEHSYIEALLRKHNGNITRAAAEAMKDRRAFARLVKKYRIDRQLLQPA
jgi:two-component system response regulator GlrR